MTIIIKWTRKGINILYWLWNRPICQKLEVNVLEVTTSTRDKTSFVYWNLYLDIFWCNILYTIAIVNVIDYI